MCGFSFREWFGPDGAIGIIQLHDLFRQQGGVEDVELVDGALEGDALAAAGVVFSAAYMLRVVQGVLWGPLGQICKIGDKDCLHEDLDRREWLLMIPLGLLVIWLGLYPAPVLEPMRGPISLLLQAGGLP